MEDHAGGRVEGLEEGVDGVQRRDDVVVQVMPQVKILRFSFVWKISKFSLFLLLFLTILKLSHTLKYLYTEQGTLATRENAWNK